MLKEAKSLLKEKFGYDKFRELQEEVISNVLKKKDTMAIMPTGAGKSICYQLPALMFEGLTIVISPLISLMKDQVEQMTELDIPSVYLNSSLTRKEYNANFKLVQKNEVRMLYLSPEAFMSKKMQKLLDDLKIECITIDEAHCISEWGHDFRPEYREIASQRPRFKDAVWLALTATATPRVQDDIQKSLGLKDGQKFLSSFNRENLYIGVIPKNNPLDQTLEFIKRFPDQPGIIYCFSRKQVESLCEDLQRYGYSVRPYHAGLKDKERKENQELFIRDDVQIIVATIAFGMGINKPNVRFVIHHDLPKSIESYYQEIGRAGRDGLDSECMLLFSYDDISKVKFFAKQKDELEKQVAENQLNALVEYAETNGCRRLPLLSYFGEEYNTKNCTGMCDHCKDMNEKDEDITEKADLFLKCVKESKEVYDISHIASILRASKTKKIIDNADNELETYGKGKFLPKLQWIDVARQLINQDYLELTLEENVILTSLGKKQLKKSAPVFFLKSKKSKPRKKSKAQTSKSNAKLLDKLKVLRKKIADEQSVPPYIVMDDSSLVYMAEKKPISKKDFEKVPGISKTKADKYYKKFTPTIERYGSFDEQDNSDNRYDRKVYMKIGEQYNKGIRIGEIGKDFDLTYSEVLDHLFEYINSGGKLNTIDWLARSILGEEKMNKITKAFDNLGYDDLEAVYNYFQKEINRDHIKIIRLYYLNINQ